MSSPALGMQRISMTVPLRIEEHTGLVFKIVHVPGGQRIIMNSSRSIQTWDLESGTQVGEAWKVKEGERVWVIALSPGGKIVASGSEDGGVRLWDIDTGKVVKKFTGHTEGVFSVCWSPDGGRVVSGSEDDTFRVWDVKSSDI